MLFLVVFGGLGLVVKTVWDASRPASLVSEGLGALDTEAYDQARASFEAALRYDPQYEPAIVGLADLAVRSQNDDLIERYVQRASKLAKDPLLRARLAFCLAQRALAQDRFQDANNFGIDAEAEDPQLPGLDALLGLAALGLEDTQTATTRLQAAVQKNQADAHVRYELALLLREADPAAALTHAEAAAQAAPDAPTWFLVAELRALRGGDVVAPLRHVVALQPDHARAHAWLTRLYLERNDLDAAQASARAAKRAAPDDQGVRIAAGRVFLAQDRAAAAAAEFEQALEIKANTEAEFLLGYAQVLSNEDVDAGKRHLQRALDAPTTTRDMRLAAAQALIAADEALDATRILDKILDKAPNDYDALLARAQARSSDERRVSANRNDIVADLRAAITLQPTNPIAPLRLGQFLLEVRPIQQREAVTVLRDCLAHNPRHPALLYWTGRACVEAADQYPSPEARLSCWNQAVEALDLLRSIDPGFAPDLETWSHRAVEGQYFARGQ